MFTRLFSNRPIRKIEIDIHSHLIPGVDDGVNTLDETLEILKAMKSLGYKKVITTPHIYDDVYPNQEEQLKLQYVNVKQEVQKQQLDIKIELGAEYYVDEIFLKKIIDKCELLSFGNNYLLFETSFLVKPFILDRVIFELMAEGYRPVLAHPERYEYLFDDKKLLCELKENGVLFQISLPSLIGAYGSKVNQMAKWLINNKMVDFIGSDIHNKSQLVGIGKALQTNLYKKVAGYSLINHKL